MLSNGPANCISKRADARHAPTGRAAGTGNIVEDDSDLAQFPKPVKAAFVPWAQLHWKENLEYDASGAYDQENKAGRVSGSPTLGISTHLNQGVQSGEGNEYGQTA